MSNTIVGFLLLLLALLGVILKKTYYSLPAVEIKRRAANKQAPDSQLYKAVAYGSSLRSLLWLYIGLMTAGGIILLARALPVWASLLVAGPVLWVIFSWLPASKPGRFSKQATALMTPLLARLLSVIEPLLGPGSQVIEKRLSHAQHTGLFERADLLELLAKQTEQEDSRLTTEELAIIRRTLEFNDLTVMDTMLPAKQVKTVLATETVGPIFIDELHRAKQRFVPVKQSLKGDFIGVLDSASLGLKTTGKVADVMMLTTYYLHQKDSLGDALHAFLTTNHPLFIVVNNLSEFMGVLSVDQILEQLIGRLPGDQFEQYADREAVASKHKRHVTGQLDGQDVEIID